VGPVLNISICSSITRFSGPLLQNTLGLSLYGLVVGFPFAILLALCLNEVRDGFFKRFTQLVTYAPYFISTVIMVSMLMLVFARAWDRQLGLNALGQESINFLGIPDLFPSIYVCQGVAVQRLFGGDFPGGAFGVDPQLYEAAKIDGANRIQKILTSIYRGLCR